MKTIHEILKSNHGKYPDSYSGMTITGLECTANGKPAKLNIDKSLIDVTCAGDIDLEHHERRKISGPATTHLITSEKIPENEDIKIDLYGVVPFNVRAILTNWSENEFEYLITSIIPLEIQ